MTAPTVVALRLVHSTGAGRVAIRLLPLLLLPPGLALVFDRDPPVGIYIQGAVIGSLYGLVAVGLILVHRANRIVNFAQASMGAVPASLALLLMASHGLPWLLALVLLLVVAAASGAAVDVSIVQRFRSSPRLILTVATIGIAQVFAFVELSMPGWLDGDRNLLNRAGAQRSPFAGFEREVGGVILTGDHLFAIVVVVILTAGLGIVFRATSLGLSMRAAAENADRAWLLGVPVRRVSTAVWAIAAVFSAVGVFLRVPLVGSLPAGGLLGTSTLLFALAPAVIARMQHVGVALVAGVALGVVDQSLFFATGNATISSAVVLPILLVALLLQRGTGARADDAGVRTWADIKEPRPVPVALRVLPEVRVALWGTRGAVAAVLLALPWIVGDLRQDFASLMIVYAIVGVSLVVLTGWAGQISLGQFALTGVGAAVTGALVADAGWDFVLAAPAGGAAGAVAALVIGIPAVRLPGLLLAVTTLAFAANTQFLVLNRDYAGVLLPEPTNAIERPLLWGRIDATSDTGFYLLCLAVLVAAMAAARSVRGKRSGRVLVASRDNPRGVQSFGVDLVRTRLAAFALSGFFAGLAGALLVHLQGVLDPAVFTPQRSLQLFAMTVIGGLGSVGGALAGAAYIAGFQYFLPDYQLLASGGGMLLLLLFFPGGLLEAAVRVRDLGLRAVALRRGILAPSLLADRGPVLPGADLVAPPAADPVTPPAAVHVSSPVLVP